MTSLPHDAKLLILDAASVSWRQVNKRLGIELIGILSGAGLNQQETLH